jgi:hypothetical protein
VTGSVCVATLELDSWVVVSSKVVSSSKVCLSDHGCGACAADCWMSR